MGIALVGDDFPAGQAQSVVGLRSFSGDDPTGEHREPGFQILVGGQCQIEPQFFCCAAGELLD